MSFGLIAFTNRGRALQVKAQAGAQLNFTRIAVGDGQQSGQAITDLTNLVHEVKSITINKFKTMPGGKAVVGGVLSNQDIVSGFWWRELGIFATDPDLGEILYCYGNAGDLAEYIPSPGGAEILEKQVDIVSIIGNAQNVSASIDESLVYATVQALEDHENDNAVHITQADRVAWNAKETPTGAQAKVNTHANEHIRHGNYAVASGSANTYSVTLDPAPTAYVEGMCIAVKINVTNTGASTINVNGLGALGIKKSNGNDVAAGNLKEDSIYTLRYNGVNFILQGEGGEYGTAGADQVLEGYTVGTENGLVTGTMPYLTGVRNAQGAAQWGDGSLAVYIEKGYQEGGTGGGEIKVSPAQMQNADPNFIPGNILETKTIFGVKGSIPVVSGEDYSIAASGKSGGDGYVCLAPSESMYIEAGLRTNGYGRLIAHDPDFIADNFLATKNIFGVQGNIPVAPTYPVENEATGFDAYNDPPNPSQGNHNVFMRVPRGYYDNTWVGVREPNLKAENIREGVTIGEGVKITGTYAGGKIKSIQSGYARISSTDSLNRTITISSVNPNYSLIIAQLSSANDSSDANKAEHNCVGVELLDATTIRLVKQYKTGSGLSDSAQCRWTVIEFEPEAIKSKQSGIASFPSDGSIHTVRSISIAPVTDTSKCLVLISMTSNNTNTPLARFIYACHAGWPNNSMFYVDLYQLASGDDRDIYWQVIEFN